VQPVVDGFFEPVELPASYIAQFQKKPGSEHFALGDQCDLLTGAGNPVTVTLTTLVGTEGDEQVGNDSYIGAPATVARPMDLYLTQGYYAVRRHKSAPKAITTGAHLVTEPLRFSVQSRIVALLTQRMKALTTNVSPRFSVQSFYLANGALRYYAKLDWSSHVVGNNDADDMLSGWLTPVPMLRILAVETHLLPSLRNVVGLGDGRTGMIVAVFGEDSRSLQLVEYRDGASLAQMPHLHEISAGE
jgi:hypothetical protein